jgi:diguanylate cyclase (GGDEF)-like protein/PAS domain S-box-containing protein
VTVQPGAPSPDPIGRAVAALPEGFLTVRADGTIGYANPALCERLGYGPDELLRTNLQTILAPEDLARAMVALGAAEEGFRPDEATEIHLRGADGSYRAFEVSVGVVEDASGAIEFFAVTLRPAETEGNYRTALERLLNGDPPADTIRMLRHFVDGATRHVRCAVAWEGDLDADPPGESLPSELSGRSWEREPWASVIGTGKEVLFDDVASLPAPVRDAAERHGLAQCWIVPVQVDDRVVATITTWTEAGGPTPRVWRRGVEIVGSMVELVLAFQTQAARIVHQATRDPLTDLLNRQALQAVLDADAERGRAVMLLDLDEFKPVNDTFGHDAGDTVLRAVAERLRGAVRPEDHVARLGGDEFVVVCDDLTADHAAALAERLLVEVSRPVDVGPGSVAVSVSIGATYSTVSGRGVLGDADRALYAAKGAGRNRVRWSDQDQNEQDRR